MSHVKTGVGLLLLSFLCGCGRQVVEFSLDAPVGNPMDSRGDLPTETSGALDMVGQVDGANDGGADVSADASADRPNEAGTAGDASPDMPAVDALAEAGTDVPIEAGMDASADSILDVAVEAGADATIDSGSDASDGGLAVGLAPTVISTTPGAPATNVSINQRPTATFSKPMDAMTLNVLTFAVTQGLQTVGGAVSFDALTNTATFTPTVALGVDMTYTVTVTTGAKDTGGRALAMNHVWTFRTAACSQAPVALGAAAGFVVLAGSTVTSTGPTSVTGDLGVSPGTAVTGFPIGIVVGAMHAGDPAAALAIASLTTAYNDAKGRTLCPVTVAGNLGGQTLYPGLYKSTTSLEISSGDLTLDARGEGAAVFIFQMASTLTTTAGRQVVLTNGAKSANVYWQVGTSATFGTTSAFKGTVMADQAITINTGGTIDGRVLARIAAVNLDSNTIVKPAP